MRLGKRWRIVEARDWSNIEILERSKRKQVLEEKRDRVCEVCRCPQRILTKVGQF